MESLLTVLLAAAMVPVPVSAAPAAALDWRACGTTPGAECATLTVPVDWSHPDGPTIGLSVARRPATDPVRRVGTLVFGPGGPWDSGVERVRDNNGRFSTLQSRFDIVSFDPRGSHDSHPVQCDDALVAAAPNPVLKSQADFDAMLAYNRRLWADCRQRTGDLWDHADMLSNIRDLDALRAALGERQLTFHGSSYGTLLGEQYAERYPARVRAMVLESVVDHSVATTGAFLTTQASAYEDAFDDFAAWCRGDVTCALHDEDVPTVWNGLFAAAGAGQRDFTPFDLVAVTLKLLRDAAYPRLASYLAAVHAGGPGQRVPSLGVVVPAFCADWSIPVRDYAQYANLMRRAAVAAPDTHYPAQVFALSMCLGWERVTNPQHVLRVRTATPLLLLNSRHDPATGWSWARSVEHQLSRHGVLVTYEGAGHGAYSLSTCVQRLTDDYLISRTVPPRGTSCPREQDPGMPVGTGVAPRQR
ncbi:alpha/beta hydrolase [Micromonospora schwarzwaldensis]|uniref:alpha/beta hydrolase n=1 Tax=Micromonospora sp. DSM 45708 TaxID=3111767 RepID=UPI0031E35A8C